MKRYYENRDGKSNQQKVFQEKSIDKKLLRKQNKRHIQFKDLVDVYDELHNRKKAMEENLAINDSEINQNICR